MASALTMASLTPDITKGRAALAAAQRAADSIGDATIRLQNQGAVKTLARAVDTWAGQLANEVLVGTRPYSKWQEHGNVLITMGERAARDAGDFASQFSRLAMTVGKPALAADAVISKVGDQIGAVLEDRRKLQARVKLFEAQRAALVGKPLKPETKDLLFGEPAEKALSSWKKFDSIASSLATLGDLMRGGKVKLETDGRGDLRPVALGSVGRYHLGFVPVLAAGTVVATVAIATSIALGLWAFFRHLDEVTRADVSLAELALVKEGKGDQVATLRKLRNESESNTDTLRNVERVVKAIGIAIGIAGVVYVGIKLARRGKKKAKSKKKKASTRTSSTRTSSPAPRRLKAAS